MLIVVTLISLMAGITFPSAQSGIDSLRLSSASDAIVSFLNGALSRADRRQLAMELTILPGQGRLELRSVEPGYLKELSLPEGVTIERVLPEFPGVRVEAPRQFLLLPGGTVPRLGLELRNRRGVRRIVRVDPVTGVPQLEYPDRQ
jgi:hypothetical protein